MIIHPMYGEGECNGLRIAEQDESSVRFQLEAIREAPAKYGVGAALALIKLPALPITVHIAWTRLEDYYPDREGEGWRNLWVQFGAAPGRQHPVFYVRRSSSLRYEYGWNTGPGRDNQIIEGDLAGHPLGGYCYFGVREDGFGLGDRCGYVGGYTWKGVSVHGEIRPDWLGVYGEGCLLDVRIRVEERKTKGAMDEG